VIAIAEGIKKVPLPSAFIKAEGYPLSHIHADTKGAGIELVVIDFEFSHIQIASPFLAHFMKKRDPAPAQRQMPGRSIGFL